MITSMSFRNPVTGVRTTVSAPSYGTHGHWVVHEIRDGWCLQWAYRHADGIGNRYMPSWPAHRGLDTRKAAEALKRELRAAGTEGWNGPPPAPEVP